MRPLDEYAASRETPGSIARMLDNGATLLIARIWLTLPFIAGGLMKMIDWRGGEAEMVHFGLHPAWLFNLASLVTQLAASLLLILNRRVWLAAGALGVFTVIATLLAHRFWEVTGPERIGQQNSFLEHWSICAGFVLVTVVTLRSRPRG